jgi:hypothetical protein
MPEELFYKGAGQFALFAQSASRSAYRRKVMKMKAGRFIFLMGLFLLATAICPAQKSKLPRIGYLREDQKTGGGKEGCGDHVIYFKEGQEHAIFASDDEGFNAWMNLNGKNVELRLIKTTLYHRDALDADAIYEYRYRDVQITVRMPQLYDYVFYFPVRIVIRRGNSRRFMKAVVSPQCD